MPIPAAPLSRANLNRLLERGVRKVVFNAFQDRVGEYERIYSVETSDKYQETYTVWAGLGQLTLKTEGAPPDWDSGTEAYSRLFTHLTYAIRIAITREAREDDLYGPVMRMSRELGRAAKYTQEIQA